MAQSSDPTLSARAELALLFQLRRERAALLADLATLVREIGRRNPNRVALNRERRAQQRDVNVRLRQNEHVILLTALAYCDALTQETPPDAPVPHARSPH